MKKVLCAVLCGLVCAALVGCTSDEEKQMNTAREQMNAGDYAGAHSAFVALKTPEGDELADYCSLMSLLQSIDWSTAGGEYTYSDRVDAAVKKVDVQALTAEDQAAVAAISAANALYVKNVQVVDAAYTVVSSQYTGFDEYMTTIQTQYKRSNKNTFLVGDMNVQLDEWTQVAQTAMDTLKKTLPDVTCSGLEGYRQQAILTPTDFWYKATDGKDDNDKLNYGNFRIDWEQYYRPARTEINNAVNGAKMQDYAAVWAVAYANVPVIPAAPPASSAAN